MADQDSGVPNLVGGGSASVEPGGATESDCSSSDSTSSTSDSGCNARDKKKKREKTKAKKVKKAMKKAATKTKRDEDKQKETEKAQKDAAKQAKKDAAKETREADKTIAKDLQDQIRQTAKASAAAKSSLENQKKFCAGHDKKLDQVITEICALMRQPGSSLVPDSQRPGLNSSLHALQEMENGCGCIAAGLASPRGFVIPSNELVKQVIDISKKHSAVFALNLKAYVDVAQASLRT